MEGFNTLIGQISASSKYTCTNQCSSCFTELNSTSKLCGLFSTEESSNFTNKMPNLTFEEIQTFAQSSDDDAALAFVDDVRFYSKNCVLYTGDAFDNSELCFIIDYKEIPSESEPIYCNITYNDVLCNSCIIPGVPTNINSTANSTDDIDCIIADCTNVDATYGTLIDVCQNIGIAGPFQYFSLNDVANNSTFSPGTCDDVVTPTLPTSAAPVTSPSTTKITESPTTVPVLISGDNTTTNNTTTTKAPIKAPAPTAVLPAPAEAPTTSSGTTPTQSNFSMSFLAAILFTSVLVILS